MTTYYIDPAAGSDVNDGLSPASPKQHWSALTWAPGNTYLGKGGEVALEQVAPNVSGTASQPITISSYGSGKHIIDGEGARSYNLQLLNRSYFRVSDLICRNAAAHAVYVQANSSDCRGLRFDRIDAVDAADIGFYFTGTSSVGAFDVETYHCMALRCGQAGFHHTQNVCNIWHFFGIADGCAHSDGGHGFSSVPQRDGAHTWTNVSGNIYKAAAEIVIAQVQNWTDGVNLARAPGAYASLGTNQWDVFSGELYVNLGGADPSTKNIVANNGLARELHYYFCVARNNVAYPDYPYHEGHGFAFDDGTRDSECVGCVSYDNEGVGFNNNHGINNRWVSCVSFRNQDPSYGYGFNTNAASDNPKFWNCVALANGYRGINVNTAAVNAEIKNCILAANVGHGATAAAGIGGGGNFYYGNVAGARNTFIDSSPTDNVDPDFEDSAALRFIPRAPQIRGAGVVLGSNLRLFDLNGILLSMPLDCGAVQVSRGGQNAAFRR